MFNNCKSLSSLPDISKWNTSNVENMSSIFNNCESLSSLPDISKWNMTNVTNMSYSFTNCKSLSSLPDISKWNTSILLDMILSYNYKSSSFLSYFSNWNTFNPTYKNYKFNGCINLIKT